MTVQYPEPTAADRRAWASKKQADRTRAAYRNSLPSSIQALTALLEDAPSPWHRAIIQARLDKRRAYYRYRTKAKNAKLAAQRAARAPEEVARILADNFPDGRQVCRTCGRTLPLSAFEPAPSHKVPLWHHCRGCQTSHVEADRA